jgi:hypothetical protein
MSRGVLAFVVAVIVALLWVLLARAERVPSMGDRDAQLAREFTRHVDAYVALHRQLEGPLPPEKVTSDPAQIVFVREALAAKIRQARAGARQGDLFTPPTAALFRRLVQQGIVGVDPSELLRDVEDEYERRSPTRARVNSSYPAGLAFVMTPPRLLQLLPSLPSELRYQFIGRDLALWDTHPHLVVDFVPDALPPGIGPPPTL